MDAQNIELEITESSLAKDMKNTSFILRELSKTGIRVALDDFGTGYSSFSHLSTLPLDTLKIDHSFTHGITEKTDNMAIISAIINLAHKLNLEVVVEGIETCQQLDFLHNLDCSRMQGFLFSKPMHPGGCEDLLHSNNSDFWPCPVNKHDRKWPIGRAPGPPTKRNLRETSVGQPF